jgi:hypothetical protein
MMKSFAPVLGLANAFLLTAQAQCYWYLYTDGNDCSCYDYETEYCMNSCMYTTDDFGYPTYAMMTPSSGSEVYLGFYSDSSCSISTGMYPFSLDTCYYTDTSYFYGSEQLSTYNSLSQCSSGGFDGVSVAIIAGFVFCKFFFFSFFFFFYYHPYLFISLSIPCFMVYDMIIKSYQIFLDF